MQDGLSNVHITPGNGWMRFTYGRADLQLCGIVQIGPQIGALARLPSGDYAQVNGDFIELLDAARLAPALRYAGLALPATAGLAPQPAVTIKKRRRIALPA